MFHIRCYYSLASDRVFIVIYVLHPDAVQKAIDRWLAIIHFACVFIFKSPGYRKYDRPAQASQADMLKINSKMRCTFDIWYSRRVF
jgi:hypothetical protein